MFMAGTRNNMLVAICLPLTLLFFQSKNKKWAALIVLSVLITIVTFFNSEISAMLSSSETSNEIKIAYLGDYNDIFSDPVTLLFGQGLGSYQYWRILGEDVSIVELTYFEILRNYGIILGSILLCMIIYPLIYSVRISIRYNYKPILIAYVFYLFMSMTNPFIFSSLGMLILSMLIADIFMFNADYAKRSRCQASAMLCHVRQ